MRDNVEGTLKHMLFLARHLNRCDVQYVVVVLLLELGISTKYDGYEYLKQAIIFYYKDPTQQVTKELYPAVAKQFGGRVTGIHVEAAIRGTIKQAWAKRDNNIWGRYFPTDLDGNIKKPTNTDFISRITNALELWKGCCEAYENQRL